MPSTTQQAIAALAEFYYRNGCVRVPNPARQRADGQAYKKGYELRLTAGSRSELLHIRALLARAGFKAGKPYQKGKLIVQPVYGREAVNRFCGLVNADTP